MATGSTIRDWSISLASLAVAVATIIYSIRSTDEERNAKLVEIGVSILRVDPQKNSQVAGARKWALDIIDANAGGVKFSPEARAQLLEQRLDTDAYSFDGGPYGGADIYPDKKPPQSK
jgi:hypothetical protein